MNRTAWAEAMRFWRKALETNGFADLRRRGGPGEQSDEVQAEFDGRAGAAGGGEVAVGDDALVGDDAGEFVGDGGVGGVATPDKEAAIVEDGRRGADGGEPAAGGVLGEHEGADARVFAEEFHPGTAGEEKQSEGGGGREGAEGEVGVGRDVAAAGGMAVVGERGYGDGDAGPAEEIDGGEGFDFLKAVEEEDERAGHGGGNFRF